MLAEGYEWAHFIKQTVGGETIEDGMYGDGHQSRFNLIEKFNSLLIKSVVAYGEPLYNKIDTDDCTRFEYTWLANGKVITLSHDMVVVKSDEIEAFFDALASR